jgi:hypothetical protein
MLTSSPVLTVTVSVELILGLVPGEIKKLHVIKNTKSNSPDSKSFSKQLSSEINKNNAGKAS